MRCSLISSQVKTNHSLFTSPETCAILRRTIIQKKCVFPRTVPDHLARLQGLLSPVELQKGAQWLGLHLPAAEMAELVAMFDEDGDGAITLQVGRRTVCIRPECVGD